MGQLALLSCLDPILHRPSALVTTFDDVLNDLISGLVGLLQSVGGVGIAAPQVGVPRRVVIVTYQDRLMPLVNPSIVTEEGVAASLEGCLSVPGRHVRIMRARTIYVTYHDVDGLDYRQSFSGLTSRIIQHEVDHLDGILITDREDGVREMLL